MPGSTYLPFAGLLGSGTNYGKDYASALAINAANYGNAVSGYNDLLARQQSSNDAISSGYANRAANAMQLLAGLEQGQRQDLETGATRATAQNAQDLIGRGLSNTTVQNTLARGVEADKNRAVNNLVGQMAGLKSSTYAALEGDRLRALDANNDAYNRLAMQRLAMQERVSAPYPDAGKYAALAQQAGANRMAGAGMQGGGGMPRQMPGAGGVQNNGGVLRNPWAGGGGRVGAGGPAAGDIFNQFGGGVGGGGFAGPLAVGGLPPGIASNGFPMQSDCPNGDCGGSWGSGGVGDPSQWGGYTPVPPSVGNWPYGFPMQAGPTVGDWPNGFPMQAPLTVGDWPYGG